LKSNFSQSLPSDNVRVSVTIPCRNEVNYIARCLDSIVQCTYNKALLGVFVSDGQSTDGTREIINTYAGRYPFIHLLDNVNKTTPYALNLGLKQEGYHVKMILGAHAEIAPDYITNAVELLQEHPDVGCVGGVLENAYEDNKSAAIGAAMSSPFGVGNAHFRTGTKAGFVDTVAFGAYTKEVVDKIGLFDESLARNQDDEYNYRVLMAGAKIYLSPTIKSKYYVRASFSKLFKQYYQYGYWKVYVNKKHRTITTFRQLIPVLFVLYLLSGVLVLPTGSDMIAGLYLSFLLLYPIVAFLFAIKQVKRITEVFHVIRTFFILHTAYGLGYLEGIIRFVLLNKSPKKSSEALTR
jgi:glycosyltransferase involved in cell wall biosynthesis